MTKNQADGLSSNLVRLMLDMEDDLLHLIAEQLAYDPRGFSDTSKWRIRQLARAGLLNKEATKLISSYTGIQSEMLREAVENAAYKEMGYVDAAVRDLQRKGFLSGAAELPAEDSAMFAYRAYLEQAESDLNMVNTVMLYNTRKAYVKAVNSAYDVVKEAERNHGLYAGRVHDTLGKYGTHMTAGTMSLQEATRRCIKELSERGIPAFIDHAGKEWTPETYITMDLRSTLGNTARAAQNMRCDQYGIKLIEVSSHMGARPLCAPYQGRIFSRDGTSGTTTDGNGRQISYIPLEDTSYGQPAGLFGINCGHVQYPFVAGCSFQTYFPYDEEENAERYKEFQKQRYMERQIRNTKRECAMLNATGDKEGFEKASLRLRSQKEKYSDYSIDHGLRVHNDRTQVNGFDKSVSSKASWVARKADGAAKAAGGSGSSGSAAPAAISIKGGSNGGTGKTYTGQNISPKGLTGGGNGSIINTKLNPDGTISSPMNKEKYERMKTGLQRNGCPVVSAKRGSDDERFLKAFQAEAISDEHGILHLGDIPSASAFFEEIIHYTQGKKYGFVSSDDLIERSAREVAANRKLLKYAKAYGFTDDDYQEISNNLAFWEKDFIEKVGVSYDEGNIKR